MTRFARGVPVVLVVVLSLAVFAGGVVVGLSPARHFGGRLGLTGSSSNTQIITAVQRQEQVVLLSLGIEGLKTKTESRDFYGLNIPGSERAAFLRYSFNAKVGIDGKDVRVRRTGGSAVTVSIPRFVVIGHDNEHFELAAEPNGVLSWITPAIDTAELVNEVLDDEAQAAYIDRNREILQDQAASFYRGIITGVDPDLSVTFTFDQ